MRENVFQFSYAIRSFQSITAHQVKEKTFLLFNDTVVFSLFYFDLFLVCAIITPSVLGIRVSMFFSLSTRLARDDIRHEKHCKFPF